MTEAELDELLHDCPELFHMAESGSWPTIRRHGLLSTSALLDLCGVAGEARLPVEAARRASSVGLDGPAGERFVVRDNKPMNDASLRQALTGGMEPAEWYRILNARVFFWLSEKRLQKLLDAGSYRRQRHDVLTLDAKALVAAHRDRITLSPINSGATNRYPAPRGAETFSSIADYPYAAWRAKRAKGERVVELAVTGGVPDAEGFVLRVARMGAGEPAKTIWER